MSFKYISIGLLVLWPMPNAGEGDVGPATRSTSRNARAVQPPPKRTKIVATVGPASREPEMLRALFLAGVNVVRLNFSHGTHDEHAAIIADVRRTAREPGLLVVRCGKDQRQWPMLDGAFQRYRLAKGPQWFIMVLNSGQLLPGHVPKFGVRHRAQHGPAPAAVAQIHEAGRCGRRNAHHVEIARQVSPRQGAVRQNAVDALPVGQW